MAHHNMDNGENFAQRSGWPLARAQGVFRAYQRMQANPYSAASPYLTRWGERADPPMAGTPAEREAEDVTGLRMLDEFLAKRRQAREE